MSGINPNSNESAVTTVLTLKTPQQSQYDFNRHYVML